MAILDDIVDWVQSKPLFWQVAIDKLIRHQNLSESDIELLTDVCKAEHGLSMNQYDGIDFDDLRMFISHATGDVDLILSSIKDIENINALCHSSELSFAPSGLTVIYGDNGSGKTSFASILKHVCSTRGKKPLINDNLYNVAARSADKKANVYFTTDGTTHKAVSLINGNISAPTLKGVNVFDSFSASHYIDGEDEIAFTPHGLGLVEKFAKALNTIEAALANEQQRLDISRLDLSLLQLDASSPSKSFIGSINPDTTRDELRARSEWTDAKAQRLGALNKTIDQLKRTEPSQQIRSNTDRISRFTVLRNKFQQLEDVLLSTESTERIRNTFNTYVTASESLRISSAAIFSDLPLSGVGSGSWKQLWESARRFYNENKGKEVFPDTHGDSNCPLCLQPLDSQAKQRFENFEEFIKNDLQQQFNQTNIALQAELDVLRKLDFSLDSYVPTIAELESLIPNCPAELERYIATLSMHRDTLVTILNGNEAIESFPTPTMGTNPKSQIDRLIQRISAENSTLHARPIDERLVALDKERSYLLDEKKLYNIRPKLAREIYRQKKIRLLGTCQSKCSTRAVTQLSNILTQRYVSQQLKDGFKAELTHLGFKNIKIEAETKGAKGKQYHFLRLDEQDAQHVSLKDVLSEGEHRCIALATFLSELSLSSHRSSVVFDDPVSSLDHKWRNKIAKRIADEAKNRQVIVFTHDISFLIMLQEHAELTSVNLEINSLTRKKQETGIIGQTPPWDAMTVNKRIGILKNHQQEVAKLERTETEEYVRPIIQNLYGKLRQTWERFVEEVFLNGTIQRFGREIQTQRLAKVVDLTAEDYQKVDENMSKCSTYMTGHDAAANLSVETPSTNELLEDIKVLEDYALEIRKRRR